MLLIHQCKTSSFKRYDKEIVLKLASYDILNIFITMESFISKRANGSLLYYKDKEMTIRHREDGPAIEFANGDKFWYLHGLVHREDGPAIEYSSGGKEWLLHGKHHRENGPAIECANGYKEYWFEGEEYWNIPSDHYWVKLCKMKKFK